MTPTPMILEDQPNSQTPELGTPKAQNDDLCAGIFGANYKQHSTPKPMEEVCSGLFGANYKSYQGKTSDLES